MDNRNAQLQIEIKELQKKIAEVRKQKKELLAKLEIIRKKVAEKRKQKELNEIEEIRKKLLSM